MTVTCTFNPYPGIAAGTSKDDFVGPAASEYMGVCVGALNNPTAAEIASLKSQIAGSYVGNGKLFAGVTANATASASDIFYGATSTSLPSALALKGKTESGVSRGSLPAGLIYSWTMTYNGAGGFNGTDVELIFGYGDPMVDEEKT